jgi:hypothetical protein
LGSFGFLKALISAPLDKKFLAIWVYHVPSKQLIYEHNFNMYQSKAQVATFSSMLLRWTTAIEDFGPAPPPLPVAPSEIEECKIHCETMQEVLALDVAAALDYHSDLCAQCRKWDDKTAFHEEMAKVLSKFGEDDATGESMVKHNTASSCVIL